MTEPCVIAVAITMLASFFVQSGEGATFALVPLVKRRVTGQVAGLVGAYGNVGAVTYLTIFSLLPMWMGGGAEPTPEVIAASNSAFFQILGVIFTIVLLSHTQRTEEGVPEFTQHSPSQKDLFCSFEIKSLIIALRMRTRDIHSK